MDKFIDFRSKFSSFIFDSYDVLKSDEKYIITYNYVIPGLDSFEHKIIIPIKD